MAFRNLRFDPAAPMIVGRRGLFVNGETLAPGSPIPDVGLRKLRTLYEAGRIARVPPTSETFPHPAVEPVEDDEHLDGTEEHEEELYEETGEEETGEAVKAPRKSGKGKKKGHK